MTGRDFVRAFCLPALALWGCGSVPPPTVPPAEPAPAAPGVPSVAPAVPDLPPPPEPVLAAQRSLASLPEGLLRTRDGRLFAAKDGAEEVLVPVGEFTMGDDATGEPDEKPAHRVLLPAFLLDRHEVTNAQFARFVAETGYRTDAERQGVAHALIGGTFGSVEGADWRHLRGPGSSIEGMERHPVVLVSWNDAKAYGDWAGRRLPTEAEFERALRAGVEGGKYPWGDGEDPPGRPGNFCDETAKAKLPGWGHIVEGYDDGYERTSPAGSFPQNPLGLFDLSGNAWEWCSDWYGADCYGRSPVRDPRGPESGSSRILRGGGWDADRFGLRCSCRDKANPAVRNVYEGFRAAGSLPQGGDGRGITPRDSTGGGMIR